MQLFCIYSLNDINGADDITTFLFRQLTGFTSTDILENELYNIYVFLVEVSHILCLFVINDTQ